MPNPLYQQLNANNASSGSPMQGRPMSPIQRFQLIQRISRDPKGFPEVSIISIQRMLEQAYLLGKKDGSI